MNILIVSDSVFFNSAYALQSHELAKRLNQRGHRTSILGLGYFGKPIDVDGVTMFPSYGHEKYGQDIWGEVALGVGADFILLFKDPYIFEPHYFRTFPVPWVSVCPVDTDEVSNVVVSSVDSAMSVITLSQHGKQSFEKSGIETHFCPLGIDPDVMKPGDKGEARKRLGVDPDKFLTLFVGRNNSFPSRKNIDNVIIAWTSFIKVYSDSLLFLHTDVTDPDGLNIAHITDLFGLTPNNWRIPDQAKFRSSSLPPDFMSVLYRAADVLLIPSTGEGFCVPAVEAQACGTPVIHTQTTALNEVVASGWGIPVTDDGSSGSWEWVPFGAMRFRPNPRSIFMALEQARKLRDHPDFKTNAIKHAQNYHWDKVFNDYWLPVLQTIHGTLEDGVL